MDEKDFNKRIWETPPNKLITMFNGLVDDEIKQRELDFKEAFLLSNEFDDLKDESYNDGYEDRGNELSDEPDPEATKDRITFMIQRLQHWSKVGFTIADHIRDLEVERCTIP